MKRLAALLVIAALAGADSVSAQQPGSTPTATSTTWRWFVEPFASFSRDRNPALPNAAGATRRSTSLAQTPYGTGAQPWNSAASGDFLVPPPPAPPAEPRAGSMESTVPMLPVPGPAVSRPAQMPPNANQLPLGPNGQPMTADGLPFIDGPEGGPLPPGVMPPGAMSTGPTRLRMSSEGPLPPELQGMQGPQGQPELEPPPPPPLVFRTREIVRPDIMKGKYYRLGEYAPLVDYKFRFGVETPWGTIPAHGMAMLDMRLRELHALEYGTRIARKNPLFVQGVVQVACDTTCGAYVFVTDPVDSLWRTAEAIKRAAQAPWSPGGQRGNCEARRRIACLIGCDPETTNPPLRCLLDHMTTSATVGWLAADTALNFGVPGLGYAAANAEFKKMMTTPSTLDVQQQQDTILKDLGVSQEIRAKFLACTSYTTSERMAFIYYLQKLVGLDNLSSLVEGAVDSKSEAEAVASIQEVRLLVELRRTRPITRVSFIGLPMIRLEDGSQMIVTSDDYIVETPKVAQMITRYRSEFPGVSTTFVTLGRVSAGAGHQLEAAGITVAHQRLTKNEAEAKLEKPTEAALATGANSPPGPRTQ